MQFERTKILSFLSGAAICVGGWILYQKWVSQRASQSLQHTIDHKSDDLNADMPTCEIMIAGSGPVGCLFASLLASEGFSCIVFEKRPDPRKIQDSGKSINLALSCRGLTALSLLTEEERKSMPSITNSVKMPGRAIHLLNQPDTHQPYSEDPQEYLNSVNRRDIGNDLLTVAEKRGVKFMFEHPLHHVDVERKVATFINKDGAHVEVKFGVLIGADGSNSQVRKEIERLHGLPSSTIKFTSGYQEYEILAGKDDTFQVQPPEAFHVWPRDSETFFIALPNADKSFTCTLFGPNSGKECVKDMSDNQVAELFQSQFPDVYKIMGREKILADHKNNPFSSLWIVDAPKWNYKGDLLILGDAAHGVVPYLGLGINCGFEGARHLFNLVKKYTKPSPCSHCGKHVDWVTVFEEFNNFKKHSDVLKDASIRNAHELHKAVKDEHFLFEKQVERELQKRFPNKFIESHALLSFTNVPFEACGKQMAVQEHITTELCKGKKTVSEVDWVEAERLIKELITVDLNKIKMWYQ